MKQWKQMLTTLGLSENETKLYLSSLEQGPQPVQILAKEAALSRVTVYALIESLTARGLMTSVQKGKKTLYAAEPPERLLSFAEKQAQQMSATVREMKSNLTELKMKEQGEKPVVKLFEGKESLIALKEDMVKTKPKVLYEFEDLDTFYDIPVDVTDLMETYTQLINMKTERTLLYRAHEHKPLKRSSYEHIFTFDTGARLRGSILTYADKVALSVYKGKQMVVLIESKELAETLQSLFELAKGNTTELTEVHETSDSSTS